jgi:hypothetical protein
VKTRPDADCGSDHKLLTATVKKQLKNSQVKKSWKLDTDNIPEEYKIDIKQKLDILNLEGDGSEEIWKALKDNFKEVVDKSIPRKEKKNRPTWISQDTVRVMEIRQKMKMIGKRDEARKLHVEIQKRTRKDKEIYLQAKCRVLEELNKKGTTRELYKQIREITRKPKTNTGKIKSRTGVNYFEKDNIIRRWKEYTKEFYKKNPTNATEFQEKAHTKNLW